jgi:hypothetical protein
VWEYRQNLRRIIGLAKENEVRCVLLTRPLIRGSEGPLCWKRFAPDYVAATIEVGAECGVPVIDVSREFKGRDEYFADESHFTEEGHRRAAALICEAIEPLLPTAGSSAH